MTSESLESLTLRQKLSHADLVAREMLELLEHGLIPKTHILKRTSQQGMDSLEQGEVTDLTIRSTVENVLNSGKFARQNADQLMSLLNSIDGDIQRVFRGR
ncbi:hypothetical protein SH661x_004682 [Planctomicrobium sp. SH661]|uniref:hypothetical protein n=1 Tax=Planctomicrobium sp. SH661 TaxID=3448124 RepID=UPI003F5C364F